MTLAVARDVRASRVGVATAVGCIAAIAFPVLLAPSGRGAPGVALASLLLVGTSMHVAATPWLFSLPEVRRVASAAPARFLAPPALALALGVGVAVAAPVRVLEGVLLALLAWQLVHFARQNVGVVAICAAASGVRGPSVPERRAIVASGVSGIAAVLASPRLVEVRLPGFGPALYALGLAVFVLSVALGLAAMLRRQPADRNGGVVALELVALCFSAPLFAFSNPFAAAGGLALAHGLQYLVLVGVVAAGPLGAHRRWSRVIALVNVTALGGIALRVASRIQGHVPDWRVLFGCYLAAYAAHFVVDGGLWRLSKPEARRFVLAALPFLATRPAMDRVAI